MKPTHAHTPNATARSESLLARTDGRRPSGPSPRRNGPALPWCTCDETHHHHLLMVVARMFCKGLGFGAVPSRRWDEGMQVSSTFPVAAWAPPRQQKVSVLLEKVSCSGVDFHAPRGRTGKPDASQEGKIAKQEWGGGETWIKTHPPHLQEGNWEKAWCGNELLKIKGI